MTEKRWDSFFLFLVRSSGWDFILLTVDSWAAQISASIYLMNKYLADESLMKRKGRTSLSEGTCAWGRDEFGFLWVVVRGLFWFRWVLYNKLWVGEVRLIMKSYVSMPYMLVQLRNLDFMWWLTLKHGWERPKIIKVTWNIKSRKKWWCSDCIVIMCVSLLGVLSTQASNSRPCWRSRDQSEVGRKCRHWSVEFGKWQGRS